MEKHEHRHEKKKHSDCDHYIYDVYSDLGHAIERNAEYD
jgi:hypothetical protein